MFHGNALASLATAVGNLRWADLRGLLSCFAVTVWHSSLNDTQLVMIRGDLVQVVIAAVELVADNLGPDAVGGGQRDHRRLAVLEDGDIVLDDVVEAGCFRLDRWF